MRLLHVLFCPDGRLSREIYGKLRGVMILIAILVIFFAIKHRYVIGENIAILLPFLVVYMYVCLGTKRLHDFGMSGWWSVWYVLVPIALHALSVFFAGVAVFSGAAFASLLSFILSPIAFRISATLRERPGMPGPNRFGPVPV